MEKEKRVVKFEIIYGLEGEDLDIEVKIKNEEDLSFNDKLIAESVLLCLSKNLGDSVDKVFEDVKGIIKEEVDKSKETIKEKIEEVLGG